MEEKENIKEWEDPFKDQRKEPFLDRHPRTALYISIVSLLISIIVLVIKTFLLK